jgi:nucleoside-diphosphate-sugar epimerase
MKATRNLRRPRVLIVGCGDVGMRCVEMLRPRARLFALTTQTSRCADLRAAGVTPLVGNLDSRGSLKRLAGLAPTVLHLAPPQKTGDDDRRTRALLATLSARRIRPARSATAPVARLRRLCAAWIVYASTTGVYGDCGGALIDETRQVRPANPRALRRVSAERQLRQATANGTLAASIARIPGIYAGNRLPLARLEKRTPALSDTDDVYTSHIHADDLAAILVRMMRLGKPARIVHASDDTALKMGEYFDAVADAYGLERAPRITRAQAEAQIDPMLLSFMRESRRLVNERMKRELRVRLRYPTVGDFLRSAQGAVRAP